MNDFILCLGSSASSHRNLLGMKLRNKTGDVKDEDTQKWILILHPIQNQAYVILR